MRKWVTVIMCSLIMAIGCTNSSLVLAENSDNNEMSTSSLSLATLMQQVLEANQNLSSVHLTGDGYTDYEGDSSRFHIKSDVAYDTKSGEINQWHYVALSPQYKIEYLLPMRETQWLYYRRPYSEPWEAKTLDGLSELNLTYGHLLQGLTQANDQVSVKESETNYLITASSTTLNLEEILASSDILAILAVKLDDTYVKELSVTIDKATLRMQSLSFQIISPKSNHKMTFSFSKWETVDERVFAKPVTHLAESAQAAQSSETSASESQSGDSEVILAEHEQTLTEFINKIQAANQAILTVSQSFHTANTVDQAILNRQLEGEYRYHPESQQLITANAKEIEQTQSDKKSTHQIFATGNAHLCVFRADQDGGWESNQTEVARQELADYHAIIDLLSTLSLDNMAIERNGKIVTLNAVNLDRETLLKLKEMFRLNYDVEALTDETESEMSLTFDEKTLYMTDIWIQVQQSEDHKLHTVSGNFSKWNAVKETAFTVPEPVRDIYIENVQKSIELALKKINNTSDTEAASDYPLSNANISLLGYLIQEYFDISSLHHLYDQTMTVLESLKQPSERQFINDQQFIIEFVTSYIKLANLIETLQVVAGSLDNAVTLFAPGLVILP